MASIPQTRVVFNQVCTRLTQGVCQCIKGQTCSSGSSSMEAKRCSEARVKGRKRTRKTKKKKQEKRARWGYSMDLMLYDDPWKIKKELKGSDLGNLSRLLLPKDMVEDLVLPVLGPEAQREAATERGTQVMIWDIDTQSMHNLVFKFWSSSSSYVFIDGWIKDFVKRRGLNIGDQIGFHWDSYKNCFDFSILLRA